MFEPGPWAVTVPVPATATPAALTAAQIPVTPAENL
jgi:hypothetical protein